MKFNIKKILVSSALLLAMAGLSNGPVNASHRSHHYYIHTSRVYRHKIRKCNIKATKAHSKTMSYKKANKMVMRAYKNVSNLNKSDTKVLLNSIPNYNINQISYLESYVSNDNPAYKVLKNIITKYNKKC